MYRTSVHTNPTFHTILKCLPCAQQCAFVCLLIFRFDYRFAQQNRMFITNKSHMYGARTDIIIVVAALTITFYPSRLSNTVFIYLHSLDKTIDRRLNRARLQHTHFVFLRVITRNCVKINLTKTPIIKFCGWNNINDLFSANDRNPLDVLQKGSYTNTFEYISTYRATNAIK